MFLNSNVLQILLIISFKAFSVPHVMCTLLFLSQQ